MTHKPSTAAPRQTATGWRQFLHFWHLMRGFRLTYSTAILALLASTAFNYIVPLVGSTAIDYALGQGEKKASALSHAMARLLGGPVFLRHHLWLAAVLMVVLTLIGGLFTYFKGRLSAVASSGIVRRLKNELYDHLQHLPSRYHDRADTGDLVQRCTSDVETVRLCLSQQVVEVSNSLILMFTAIPVMLALSAPMTAVSFTLLGPIILFGFFYFRKVKHLFREVDEAEGQLTTVVQENLTGLRVVRAFARQDYERAKFAQPNQLYRDRSLHLLHLMAWYWSISDFVCISQNGLVLIAGTYWIAHGTLSVGTLFAFLAILNLLLWPIRQMGRILTDLGKAMVSLSRIREILSVERESQPAHDTSRPRKALAGAIDVSGLTFAHGTAGNALADVSFHVNAGETLAILGPSGAGKSTLIHLLLRLYDYETGSIRVDGQELSGLDRQWLRSQFGVVMQEPFLYSKTLGENIRLGRRSVAEAEISEAARIAYIHDTITQFEQGYGTLIGERGITLSGGQRQRVALARAIIRDPAILILDDALSAVDSETESAIIDALRKRRGRRTTLVIAHRLSTLTHADRIIVFDKGQIVQEGTHADLSAKDGLYRRLWEIQTSIREDFQTSAAN